MAWRVTCGDARAELPGLADASIDLVLTSPPYADLRAPGVAPGDYVDWFLPIGAELFRILRPGGSFVLNINDCVRDGERQLYVYDLVCALKRRIGFAFIERYVWRKTKWCPLRVGPRPIDIMEYVFWFGKGTDVVFNTDAVRRPYSPATVARAAYGYTAMSKRKGRRKSRIDHLVNPLGALPVNVLDFTPVDTRRVDHDAPMPEGLAEWCILAGSRPGDTVLDPFAGWGTTLMAAQRLGRDGIGIEIMPENCERIRRRLGGQEEPLLREG